MPWIRVLAPVGAASAVSLLGFICCERIATCHPGPYGGHGLASLARSRFGARE